MIFGRIVEGIWPVVETSEAVKTMCSSRLLLPPRTSRNDVRDEILWQAHTPARLNFADKISLILLFLRQETKNIDL